MKKLFLSFLISGAAFLANAQVKMPALSPVQTVKQEFGMGFIELKYARPSARGRKVFGEVVSFDEMWRTGANAATQIRFSDPVEINGKKIDTGNYALYTVPGKESWEIILNKGTSNWGLDGYKKEEDVLRFTTAVNKLKQPVETFTISFENMTTDHCDLHLSWEKTDVAFTIITDNRPKMKAQIEAALQQEKKPYYQAAQYYNEYETNLPLALEMIDKAIESNKTAYWMLLYKAKIQLKMGDKAGAFQTSKLSEAAAEAQGNKDYIKMNKAFQDTIK
jgi:hypothetical protein